MVRLTGETGLSAPKSSQQPPPRGDGNKKLCTPSCVLTCGVHPPANTRIHQQMKLQNHYIYNSYSFILQVYSGRVNDVIHNNLTHLCVFVSCWWLLNMTVSGIQAQWYGEDAYELTTDWGSLSPEALPQVQMQESDPGLVKPSYTLFFRSAVSAYSINSGRWSAICWICHPPGKELYWIGHVYRGGDFEYNPSLKSWITMTVSPSKKQIFPQLSSVTTEDKRVFCCVRDTVRALSSWREHEA
jgi:hypothetical protein